MARISFPKDSLYLVTDKGLSNGRPLSYIVEEAILGGVQIVQYREKNFQYNLHFAEAREVRNVCKKHSVIFLVNDRVDLALALNADGVHLGQSDMPPQLARRLLGGDRMIGWSIETEENLEFYKRVFGGKESDRTSVNEPVLDYLGVSPVFSTPTKTDTIDSWGLEGLQFIRSQVDIPLVGIGGLDSGNVKQVISAGADSIAVVSAICLAENPRNSARTLSKILAGS